MNRNPKGTPTGGQFAAGDHAEASVNLDGEDQPVLEQRYDGDVLRENRYTINGELQDPSLDQPALVKFNDDGTPRLIGYYSDGLLHDPSPGRPAEMIYVLGGKTEQSHYRRGKLQDSADGEPAVMTWNDMTASVATTRRYQDGLLHADAGAGVPAVVGRYPNGKLKSVEFYENDVAVNERSDQPHARTWFENGDQRSVAWRKNGLYSNAPGGGPGLLEYHGNGVVAGERFYDDRGNLSNGPDGEPAQTSWHPNGHESFEHHVVDGETVDGPGGVPGRRWWDADGNLTHEERG